jgi:iron(III) transport system ATP-binding protein
MPEIRVANLTKSYGPVRALDDISFVVQDKEFLTLLGPSGCGKSTSLMSIAGFEQPDSGSITVGDSVYFDAVRRENRRAENRELGIVFQSYAIWPHMTVFDNVAFPLTVRRFKSGAIRSKVGEMLELVEMGPQADRYPHELSGGQQQRVAIARALSASPSVLLLDEPFSNLDAKLRDRARGWLKGLHHQLGLTAIFVTHDQDEALSMSDRILVLDEGKVLQSGTPEEIYRRPANRFVADFVGHCNFLTGTVRESDRPGQIVVRLDRTEQVLLADTAAAPAVGKSVTVAVRPEAIQLGSEGTHDAGRPNCSTVTVSSVSFLGDHYEYETEMGALPLTIQTTSSIAGERLRVHIPPRACAIIDESSP